ncbi:type I-E CRISPR-associated protein Cas6/Cse3/CasE [soil metagenome]
MAYLSRIWINPLRHQAQRLLGDPHAMHAVVLGGIAVQPVTERVLWRLDADEPRRPALLVLSESRPSWEHIVEQAGWPSTDEPQAITRSYTPLLERIHDGSEFAFRLTANPTQSTRRPDKLTAAQRARADNGALPRSTRVGHRTVAHQLGWLLQRTERWGFAVPPAAVPVIDGEMQPHEVRIIGRERRSFRRGGGSDGRVALQVVTFEGHLVVTDSGVFKERLLSGFGPAKAYGCGLLTLAPLPTACASD